MLPLEYAVRRVMDCPIASVMDKLAYMLQTFKLVEQAPNWTAAGIAA